MTDHRPAQQWRAPERSYTTERALRALELLAWAPHTAPQVARALAIHDRTARRLLTKLVDERYADRLPVRGRRGYRYRLTPRLLALAAEAATRLPGANHAHATLHELAGDFQLTAALAVPSYRHVLVLVQHGPDARGGWTLLPVHATAAGKALLAYRPAWRQSVCATPLDPCTSATITTAELLERDCASTRQRGYAIERDELEAGRRAIAVTVPTVTDQPPSAALTLVCHDGRDLPDLLGAPLHALTDAALRIADHEASTDPLALASGS